MESQPLACIVRAGQPALIVFRQLGPDPIARSRPADRKCPVTHSASNTTAPNSSAGRPSTRSQRCKRRWNGRSPAKDDAWSLWTDGSCPDLDELTRRWADVAGRRAELLSQIDDAALEAELSFKLLNGDASSMRLGHQMQHVVNHATLHRGQVVGMIRQFGIVPPSTDLIFYFRRGLSPN